MPLLPTPQPPQSENGAVVPTAFGFLDKTYDEALALVLEARNYIAVIERRERRLRGPAAALKMSCEALRITSRLTQVMAWLLAQKAVRAGEITQEEAMGDKHRLGGETVCLDVSLLDDEDLPEALRDLGRRSLWLYQRVARLERMMAAKGA